ncbi:MAG: GNAT family N-acetyltransferase, partial [Lachnospiraceae bacterium]
MSQENAKIPSLALRPAAASDSGFLLALRNDPKVRANSFQKDEVKKEDHERWLAGVLSNPARHLYILEEGDTPAGQVRIDVDPSGEAEISYSIA